VWRRVAVVAPGRAPGRRAATLHIAGDDGAI